MTRLLLAALCPLLAGCGPSEDNGEDPPEVIDPTIYVPILDQSSSARSDLVTISVSPQTATLVQQGSLDRSGNILTIGGASGVFSTASLQVLLSDGSQLTIENLPTDFVERATLEPGSGASSIAVIGVPTAIEGLPDTGSATYTGADLAQVQIVDGNTAYDLTGNVSITADFAAGLIDVTLFDLDGSAIGPSGVAAVTDLATIEMSGATLTNGSFTGGTLSLSSDDLPTTFSSGAVIEMDGQLFGPNGDEIGGVLRVDDSDFTMVGTFVGD